MSFQYTLLFVDDEEAVLKSLRRIFAGEGYRILLAASAKEALTILEKEKVHLIVSDYRMPGMDGLQLLHAVQDRWPETIRVMLTGYADVKAVMDDISSGAIYRFISKPWDDEDLKLAVHLALQQYVLIKEIKHLKETTAGSGKSEAAGLGAPEMKGADGRAGQFTLLFVDDEEIVLKSLARVFHDEGYHVLTAESGAEALAILEKQQVHLIVSDYRMPGMSGLQLLRQVKEHWPATVRVMLTGYADVQGVMGDISDGVIYKFISKPWQNEDLKMSIRLALRQYALIREIKELTEDVKAKQTRLNG